MTLLPEDVVEAYAVASLRWSGTTAWRTDTDAATAGVRVWTKAVGDGLAHIPLFLAMDLRTLAGGDPTGYPEGAMAHADPLLRARYENEAIGRLLRHRPFARAREIVEFHRGDSARADRLAMLLLEQLAGYWPDRVHVNAAHLRRGHFAEFNPGVKDIEKAAARWDAWRSDHALDDHPMEALETFVDSVRGTSRPRLDWDRLIQTQDLFELDHLPALDREYLRLGTRRIIAVRESIPPLDPHDIRLSEEDSEAETRFMDQSLYPTGGFSELTNRGSFENLVLSELIYMGEGHDAGVDLFDLRYVEGELLYYSRDSGELRRKRRRAVLVVDLTSPLDIRLPEHEHQLVVLVAGMLLALVRDLALLFFRDSLLFQVQLIAGPDGDDAHRLLEVLSILLQGPIQHGLLEVVIASDPNAWFEEGSATRKTYAIAFGSDDSALERWTTAARDLSQSAQPLFATVVDLHGAQRQDSPCALQLSRREGGLLALHHDVLETIMNGRLGTQA